MKKILGILFISLMLAGNAWGAGIDANTKLYFKFAEGADEATDCTDFSDNDHQPTFVGTAKLDDAVKLSAGGYSVDVTSLLLDGNSDFVKLPASADWTVPAKTGYTTIDFWFRTKDVDANAEYVYFIRDTGQNNCGHWLYLNEDDIYAGFRNDAGAATTWDPVATTQFGVDTWYHMAVVRDGIGWGCFIDGNQVGYISWDNTYSGTPILSIGDYQVLNSPFEGNIAHFRFQNSNALNATVESDNTGTCDVPTAPYSAAATGWTHTINGVVAASMASVNGVAKASIAEINQT